MSKKKKRTVSKSAAKKFAAKRATSKKYIAINVPESELPVLKIFLPSGAHYGFIYQSQFPSIDPENQIGGDFVLVPVVNGKAGEIEARSVSLEGILDDCDVELRLHKDTKK